MPHKYASCNFLLLISAIFVLSCSKSTIKPLVPEPVNIPGVTVCSKTWMTKNLDVITFKNGDTIPQVSGDDNWGAMAVQSPTPAWCYLNDNPSNDAIYGKLYNWAAVTDPRGLAPEGWHVATYEDWIKLIDSCLGGKEIAGKEMKEAGFTHWPDDQVSNLYGSNTSGLTCLPGGYRSGHFFPSGAGFSGNWWCGTGDSIGHPYMMWLYHAANEVNFQNTGNDAVSVRCVKD